VPWLIGAASMAVLIPGRFGRLPTSQGSHGWDLTLAVFAVAVYGGYFGAAAGVMLLAGLMFLTGEALPRSNAMKNLLLGLANAVAAVGFALFGPVHWVTVLPLAAGFLIGGRIGPVIVRHTPTAPLRLLIAFGGLGLAVHLGLDAYG
jgi:uncharacterized membrane protein YfcA